VSRKKRKRTVEGYLRGVTWRDVMKGKAVTRADLDQKQSSRIPQVAYRCRDCPFTCRLVKTTGTRRCVKCGGVLDPAI
jgi:hypothetical protein